MVLIDEAQELAPHRRPLAVVGQAGALAVDQDLATVRPLQQARNVQQGRLAAARLADQRHDLAGMQGERDAAQDLEATFALHEGPPDVPQ